MKNNIKFYRTSEKNILKGEKLKEFNGSFIFEVNDVVFNNRLYESKQIEAYDICATVYSETKKIQQFSGKTFYFLLWIGTKNKMGISQFLEDFAIECNILSDTNKNSWEIDWYKLKGFVLKADFAYNISTENTKTGVVYKQPYHNVRINRDTLKNVSPDSVELKTVEADLEIE